MASLKFLITLVILSVSSLTFTTEIMAAQLNTPVLGDKVYLNGIGGNPQTYLATPYDTMHIYELPNKVISEKESIYKRSFQTNTTSVIHLDGIKLTATLDNFRDLKIVDGKGKILAKRKITGATSLYEIRSKALPIAWAVGWHNNAREHYKNVDFTVFRIYYPMVKSGKITIEERVVKGLAQTKYQKAFTNNDQTLLVEATALGCGASGCYYCFPNFIFLDPRQGIVSIQDVNLLKKHIDTEKVEPLLMMFWLIHHKELPELRNFITHHFDEIVDNLKTDYSSYSNLAPNEFDKSNKEVCKAYLKNEQTAYSEKEVHNIIDHCFPFINEDSNYRFWLDDSLGMGGRG